MKAILAALVPLVMALAACGASGAVSPSVTTATPTAAPLSITSPSYTLLTRIASNAYGLFNDINAVTLPDECASRPSFQCQMTLPEAMQQQFTQLQQDVGSLASSGVLAGYSSSSPIASDLRDMQDDTNGLPATLGQEIEGLDSDNPADLRVGGVAQSELAGIGSAALAMRTALTTP